MIYCDIEKAVNELDKLAHSCVAFDDVVNVSTDDGNVVMLSEQNYRNLIESLYLAGIKGVHEDIEEVIETPTSCFSKKSPLD